jgi:hypothetical protein
MRRLPVMALTLLLLAPPMLATPVWAQSCPLPGQKTMQIVRLYFGLNIPAGGRVSDQQWRDFLTRTVTPRFPAGFTVYEAKGQWQDPRTHAIDREDSRILELATQDTAAARRAITEISQEYRTRFRQQAVGIVSDFACGTF